MILRCVHIRVEMRLEFLMREQEERHLFVAHGCWCTDLKPFDFFGLVAFDRGQYTEQGELGKLVRPSDQVSESCNDSAARELSFAHSYLKLEWIVQRVSNCWNGCLRLISLSLKQCQTVKGLSLHCRFAERRSMKSI